MGADIHSRAEVNWGSGWEAIEDAIWRAPYFREDEPVSFWNVPYAVEPFRERNYALFALLADVRNYWDITPIDQPRGVPQDASSVWRAYVDRWGQDLHSMSWFTYDELKEVRQHLHGAVVFSDGTSESYEALFGQVLDDVLAPVSRIAEGNPKTPVRFVFGFDN